MPPTQESREEAIRRLQKSASALEARSAPPKSENLAATAVVSQAYKIIAELIGGVVVGLAIGFASDQFLGTGPWGLIGGVLVGFALAIFMAKRTADRLMAQAQAAQDADPTPAPPVRRYDDETDD